MSEQPDYDFLQDEAPDEVVAEVVAPEPVAETVATPEPPAAVVPTTTEPEEERVPVAALMAERRKRQEAEARARQYEQQQGQQQQSPGFYEAPEQFVEQRLAQRTFAMSEAMAREMYPDYDEVIDEFVEFATANPYLQAEVANSPHPAAFAYKQGKALRERKAMEDMPAFKAKLEAEIRTKLEAEYKAKEEAKQRAADAIPPDLSTARASRDEDVVVDDSLDSILKTKR